MLRGVNSFNDTNGIHVFIEESMLIADQDFLNVLECLLLYLSISFAHFLFFDAGT